MRALALVVALSACAPAGPSVEVADALSARAGADAAGREAHFRSLLADYLDRTERRCLPPVAIVLSPPAEDLPWRRIDQRIPHYDFVDGPVRFRIGARDGYWRVAFRMAVVAEPGGLLELPDCALAGVMAGHTCEGTPYEEAEGLDACPGSGRFEAPATRENLEALVARWSSEVEALWNRDAEHYDLPVRYDFSFVLADGAAEGPIDVVLPLRKSCGRTPYFSAIRSGWSISVLAHEVGHFLGLLDEYEALSGITPLYPKTPFVGSENSRMGVSMKTHTRLLPLHHYLVLRPYHCDEEPPDSFDAILTR